MRKTILTALAASVAIGLTGTTVAADEMTFESLDGNSDGFIARDEVPADHKLAGDFSTYDTDADGQLSRAEFEAYKSAKRDTREY